LCVCKSRWNAATSEGLVRVVHDRNLKQLIKHVRCKASKTPNVSIGGSSDRDISNLFTMALATTKQSVVILQHCIKQGASWCGSYRIELGIRSICFSPKSGRNGSVPPSPR
jgi:hypothetical protein